MYEKIKKLVLVPILCIGLAFPTSVVAQESEQSQPVEESVGASLNLELPEFSYSILREGQTLTANSDTYLLTPAGFARITTEYQFMQRRYELYLSERLSLANTEHQFRVDILTNQNLFLEGELQRTNNLLVELQESRRNDLTPLWVAVSFVAGCALTVGLVYALQPGVQ